MASSFLRGGREGKNTASEKDYPPWKQPHPTPATWPIFQLTPGALVCSGVLDRYEMLHILKPQLCSDTGVSVVSSRCVLKGKNMELGTTALSSPPIPFLRVCYMCVHVSVCTCVCVGARACGGQKSSWHVIPLVPSTLPALTRSLLKTLGCLASEPK